MQNLANKVEIERPLDAVAAGQTDQNGTGVDMQGFDGVMFIALFGTLTSTHVTSMKAQQSSDDADADAYADIEGSDTGNLGEGDSDLCLVLDVFRPRERYVRPVVLRGTANAVIDGVIAIKYHGKVEPQTVLGALALARKVVASPAEGTA